MSAKLVRVGGEDPGEHELWSFNTLGSDPDCSIVFDGAAVHALIVLTDIGQYVVKSNDGEVDVNGERADRRVLRSGDEITLGTARFRFVAASASAPPVRAEPARIQPAWTHVSTQRVGRVVALHRGRYALVHATDRRPMSRLLARGSDGWRVCAEIPVYVRGVWELGDGALIVAGKGEYLQGYPGRLEMVPWPATAPIDDAWGPSPRCVYALADGVLLHFDGARWRAIDLAAQGVARDTGNGPVRWTTGACDPTGRCWLGGADMKHGTLATGIGTVWERAGGAGIGALVGVVCGADGTMFVCGVGVTSGLWPVGRASHRIDPTYGALHVGTDPRWPAYGGAWRSLAGFAGARHWVRLLRCCGAEQTRAVVVGATAGSARECPVFFDERWTLVALPASPASPATLDVTHEGRLTFATDTDIWETGPLLTPASDRGEDE